MHKFLLAVATAVLLPACATNSDGDDMMFGINVSTRSVQAPIIARAENVNSETQIANYGDIIFEQNFYPINSVRTSSALYQKLKFAGLPAGEFQLSKDTPLYWVGSSKIEGETYCLARAIDENSSALETIFLGGLIGTAEQREQGQRYCLTDTNDDGNFEEIRVMQDHAIYMIQGGLLNAAPILLENVVSYEKLQYNSEELRQRIGLELSDGGWIGDPMLFVRALQGEKRQRIQEDIIKIGKKEDLPTTITYKGVVIEVSDYDKDTLTYRIKSGFKPGTGMGLFTYTTYK